MLTERGKLFEEKEPSLSDDEVSAAYENGKIAASSQRETARNLTREHRLYRRQVCAPRRLFCDGAVGLLFGAGARDTDRFGR